MAGETLVETTPVQDNKIVDDTIKTDKEAIVEEEKEAQAENEEKKDEEKEEKEKTVTSPPKEKVEKPKRFPVHKQDFEKDVVYLYQYNRTHQIPSISPFCLKVESWLKLHGIKYENVDHKIKLRSKRGMLPFVELNGEEISDSNHIIETLSKKFEKNMPADLTAEQKQVQHAMMTMVENHFNWAMVQWKSRDIDSILKGYKMDLSAAIGSKLPASLLNFYFKHTFLRKGLKKVKAQGFGASSNEEMEQMGKDDMKVCSDMLGDKEFMFGDEPSLLDLTVYSHMAPVLFIDKEFPCVLRDFMESDCQNLAGLVNRMKDRCWGDHWSNATGEEQDLNPHIPKPVVVEPETKKEDEKEKEGEKEAEKENKETEKEEKKPEEKETADEKKEEKEKEEDKKWCGWATSTSS